MHSNSRTARHKKNAGLYLFSRVIKVCCVAANMKYAGRFEALLLQYIGRLSRPHSG